MSHQLTQVPSSTTESSSTWEEDNDSFSEQAKHKYLVDSNDDSNNVMINAHYDHDDKYQWSIPDVEGGAYLNTLESKLYKLTNGRGLGRSLRMGTGSNNTSNQKSKKKIEYSDGCKKCVDYFEEEIDLNVPKEELIGAAPLLEESELLHDNTEESNEAVGFEDLQIKELEEESWHQDYSINEEEKQVIYDKKTGELKLDQEENTVTGAETDNISKIDMSDDEESESEDEDDDEQDEYGTMELHDDEEENHFESYQTSNVTNNDDDWEAEFP